ncbi:MAG: cytochrome c3 family protein, partial [Acidithiobacillales bacterium]
MKAGLLAVLLGGVLLPLGAAPPTNDDCLTCHADEITRADGRKIAPVGPSFAASVHGEAGVSCVDCHADLAKAELPHAEKLARVDCSPCHAKQVEEYGESAHAAARAKSPLGRAATCVSCHGMHDILPSSDPKSRTNHFNVPATCLMCHGNPEIVPEAPGVARGGAPSQFVDSIHGTALERIGLSVAPNCASCHGAHQIRGPSDPKSRVARMNIPETCGRCHAKILTQFETGVHYRALMSGNPRAPVCIDCHSAHGIKTPETVAWKVGVIKECGTCHVDLIETYRDTYHGQVTELGFARVATCADCHGAHAIYAPSDPASSVSKQNLLSTCRKCHPSATANFAKYDPHADYKNRRRSPLLYYTARFMKWLLIGVFSFFGVHTLLWLPRSIQERRL